MACRVIPYEGKEPYIFVSYCHKDQSVLYPIFEQMARDNYRIWYDEANHAGDDWMDNIENHLEDCKAVVAFISGNSSLSHNCKSEIVYALKCKKKVIPILIDGSDLPKGLRMQLSHLHYLNIKDFATTGALLAKLYETEEIKECLAPAGTMQFRTGASPVPSKIPESAPAQKKTQHVAKAPGFFDGLTPVRLHTQDPKPEPPATKETVEIPIVRGEYPLRAVEELPRSPVGETGKLPVAQVADQPSTEKKPAKVRVSVRRKASPLVKAPKSVAAINAETNDQQVPVEQPAAGISAQNSQISTIQDVPEKSQDPHVSEILSQVKPSANVAEPELDKTAVQAAPKTGSVETYGMTTGSFVGLQAETVYMNPSTPASIPSTGDLDGDVTVRISSKNLSLLLRPATQQSYILRKPQTKIGRSPIKSDIIMEGNDSISKYHADIIQYQDNVYLRDVNSANGTYYNGEQLEPQAQVQLKELDFFRISDENLIFFSGKKAHEYINMKRINLLVNESCSALCEMGIEDVLLNRNNPWKDGTLSDTKIHRAAHARIKLENDGYHLINEAPARGNGTFLNDLQLTTGESRPLSPGDRIRLGETTLTFLSIPV